MKKTRIALVGATGRMGLEILDLTRNNKAFEVSVEISRSTGGFKKINSKQMDIVLDVSLPEGFEVALDWCIKNKKPFVSGTTGLSKEQIKKLDVAAKIIPVLWSSNMSMGIALLQKAIAAMGKCDDFDIAIEETHHKRKKDRPSGTAILLQTAVEKSAKRKIETPVSLRGGGVFGIHKVHYFGEEETISFEHQALNRKVFARGALIATSWLVRQKPGRYGMQDVLGETV